MFLRMKTKRLAAFIVCLFALTYTNAQKVSIGGLKYFLYPETHEAAIDNVNTWSGELDIPSEIKYDGETYTVTGMASLAFDGCSELIKVRIPKTINHIVHGVLTDDPNITGQGNPDAMNPFNRCTALELIEVDENNPIMSSEEGILYSKDKTRLYGYPAGMRQETFVVPDNVTWIGLGAFSYNHYLSSLIIPNSVTFLGSGICDNCVNLKTVRLSESINYLEAYSFNMCESLKFLDIPESVQGFGESIFRWTHLEKMVIRGTFPNGLRYDTFYSMDDSTIIYVQQSEIEKFKKIYHGIVLTLEDYTSNIDQMESHQLLTTSYDLQGRQISSVKGKGIYIQNGKKRISH